MPMRVRKHRSSVEVNQLLVSTMDEYECVHQDFSLDAFGWQFLINIYDRLIPIDNLLPRCSAHQPVTLTINIWHMTNIFDWEFVEIQVAPSLRPMSTAENSLGWKKENRGFDMNTPFATIVLLFLLLLLFILSFLRLYITKTIITILHGSDMFRCTSTGQMLSNFCIEPGSLTDVDIRKGYRAAARRLHPDRGGKSEEFQELFGSWATWFFSVWERDVPNIMCLKQCHKPSPKSPYCK